MIWPIIVAIAMGFAVAFQPITNALAAGKVGLGPLFVASNAFVLLVSVAYALWFSDRAGWSALPSLRLDLLLGGGLYGCVIIFGGVYIFPKLGASVAVALIVLSQCVFAALIDHFGFYGLPREPISMARVFGLALICAGVLVIQFWRD